MPTTLPHVTSPIISVLPQPSDPPSKRDITRARCLTRDTLVPYDGGVNEDAKEQQVISECVEGPGQTARVVDESVEKFLNSESFIAIVTKAVETAVKPICEKLSDKIDERFGKINEKLDKINERADKINERLDSINERLDNINERLDNIVEGLGVNNNLIAIQRSSYRAPGRPPSFNSY